MTLVDSIRSLFAASKDGRGDEPLDARLAAAALAVHAIAVDGDVTEDEKRTLREVLQREYSLGERETKLLIEEARARDREAVDLFAFTSVLKRNLDAEGRRRVVAMLWRLAYADGEVHEFEDNLVWRIAELLGVPARERVLLRQEMSRQEMSQGAAAGPDAEE
ncbi:MAG: TerB family tellurite resistance protein [Flavobacteriaceae bacterium]